MEFKLVLLFFGIGMIMLITWRFIKYSIICGYTAMPQKEKEDAN
jgi:hypothetical protein